MEWSSYDFRDLLQSPYVRLEAGHTYLLTFTLDLLTPGGASVGFLDRRGRPVSASRHAVSGPGVRHLYQSFTPATTGRYSCLLASHVTGEADVSRARDLTAALFRTERAADVGQASTALAHWGPVRRAVHRLCRASRAWNSLVAALEMRLGREELLSLPQYMALCPTGQCNALCGFCSVTLRRSGIVKRQMPFDRIQRLVAPVANTIRMYGLEGNGEPTLYDRFDDLVRLLGSRRSQVYLISNGERLSREQVELILASQVETVNFSLNAATAETHQRVMKLKHFDRVVENVKRLTRGRARGTLPSVAVSFVVHHDNIHEVQDFLRLAETELEVDRVLVRPLSEIANDLGTVQDLRALVPFESDVRDALDSVSDYLSDTERRARIEIDPDTFRATRPDPIDRVVSPLGYEDRLLAPRRGGWQVRCEGLGVSWHLNVATLVCPATAPPGELWRSDPIPVERGRALRLELEAVVEGSSLEVQVVDAEGRPVAAAVAEGGRQRLEIPVATGSHEFLQIAMRHRGGALRAEVDFGRLRTPGPLLFRTFRLPHAARWEIASPGVQAGWSGSAVRVQWHGAAGPYLLKSYSVPCLPGRRLEVPVEVDVTEGVLGIGFLDEDSAAWIHTARFEPGHREPVLRFDAGANRRVTAVLYSCRAGALSASVEWGVLLDAPPARRRPVPLEPLSLPPVQETSNAARAAPPEPSPATPERYYCQKPWTDLHMFSVDGRMDVCCIATGASQERYSLGSLVSDDFQSVWNGPVAREFRRTVNSDAKLPPCARCPMPYAYQGPGFDPEYTRNRVLNSPYLKYAVALGDALRIATPLDRLDGLLERLLRLVFRGFRIRSEKR